MGDQLLNYAGGVLAGDTANSPNAYVKRDASGNMYGAGLNAAMYLASAGALFLQGKLISASTALDETATVIKANAAGGAITLTLPPASASADQFYLVIKTDSAANVVTLKGSGTDNINAANTYTALATQWNIVLLWCDGTQWYAVKMAP